MKKWVIALLTLTAIYFIFLLCSCTVNYKTDKEVVTVVRIDTVIVDKSSAKLERKVKKLKKTLKFRTYQRDSLQCKLDSFIYSIIKKEEDGN